MVMLLFTFLVVVFSFSQQLVSALSLNGTVLEQNVGSLLPCRLSYQDIILITTITTSCADVGLENPPYHAISDEALLTGVRLAMGNCGFEAGLARSATNCTLLFPDDPDAVVIDLTICNQLADPNVVLLCHIPALEKSDRDAMVAKVEREAEKGSLLCPSSRPGTCPCCPGAGEPVILYSFMPHYQADCACRQLGLNFIPMANNPEWQKEVSRRLVDCTGKGNSAWVGGKPNQFGQCPAFVPTQMVYQSNNRPIYKPSWVDCSTPLPVICRAPTNPHDYACYECRFNWSPECCKCPGISRHRSHYHPKDTCYSPDVCKTESESSESSESSSSSSSESSDCCRCKNEIKLDSQDEFEKFECEQALPIYSISEDKYLENKVVKLPKNHFLVLTPVAKKESQDICKKQNAQLASVSLESVASMLRHFETVKVWTADGLYVKYDIHDVGALKKVSESDKTRTAAVLCRAIV